jgi:negative regulator of sigma E activity
VNRADSHPRELISAWLDGELGQEERTVVLEHLAGCASCRALVDDLTILAKATREEPIPPVPEGLEERIAWRLRSAAAAQRRPRWRTLVPLTAVASLMVVGILVVLLREQRLAPSLPSFAPPQESQKAAAPEPPASGRADEGKPLDSLAEKKESDERLRSVGYLGRSKDAESGAVAKQAPAAPPPPALARDKGCRTDPHLRTRPRLPSSASSSRQRRRPQ